MNSQELQERNQTIIDKRRVLESSKRNMLFLFKCAYDADQMIETFRRHIGSKNPAFAILEKFIEKERDDLIEQGIKQHGILKEQERFFEGGTATRDNLQTGS